jgi:hypothetical protein
MTRIPPSVTARNLRAVFILGCSLTLGAALSIAADNPQPGAPRPTPRTAPASSVSKASPAKPQTVVKPLWADLTPVQQQALAPLAPEWDKLDSFRKNKWLAIGNRYASMKPDEQLRVQERMREWVRLTPEQRRIARESYARAKKLNPDQKSAHWEEYQQLPEEQKKKLAEASASKKHVATLPSPTAQAKTTKILPPIKSAPKPVIEQSVTPQAANQSALQAAPQPSK